MRPLMPPVQTPDNLFHDGDPSTGDLGTIVEAEHLNNVQQALRDVQAELISVLTAAGVETNPNTFQLVLALEALFAAKSDTLGALSSLVGAADKLPYFTGPGAATLTNLTSVGRNVISQTSIANLLSYLGLEEAAPGVSVVGMSRNARMNVAAASSTAIFTADELIVGTALGGKQYRLPAFNKTINLAITGPGGMDSGAPPVTGFVALYAIYKPSTAESALLSVNATAAVAPEIYPGSSLPAGYTASALVAVVPVASSQFAFCTVQGRSVGISSATILSGTAAPGSVTAQAITAIPLNAQSVDLTVTVGITANDTTGALTLAASSGLVAGKLITIGAAGTGGTISETSNLTLPVLANARTLYYRIASATLSYGILTSGYSI
ncbi:TPA: hypothetical protein R5C98_001273 [Yersinia enterocolitica]|nr:hypothetical protein [Yersinia enterocolitica]